MRIVLTLTVLMVLSAPVKSPGSLRLSELMINPADGREWIELAAIGDVLSGCQVTLSDASGRIGRFTVNHPIRTGGFLLAVQDTAMLPALSLPDSVPVYRPDHWPTLNNDGDSLTLSVDGTFIEMVAYRSEIVPATGHSLERIDITIPAHSPDNWGECSEWSGNTAGLPNSLHSPTTGSTIKFWVDPNPFNPSKGSGQTYFHFIIPSNSARATLDIFTVDGRPLIRIASDLPVGTDSPAIPWNGRGKNGLCKTGRYVAALRTFDQNGRSENARCTVILIR